MLNFILSGNDFKDTRQLSRISSSPNIIITVFMSLLISNCFKNLGVAIEISFSLICSLNLFAILAPKCAIIRFFITQVSPGFRSIVIQGPSSPNKYTALSLNLGSIRRLGTLTLTLV